MSTRRWGLPALAAGVVLAGLSGVARRGAADAPTGRFVNNGTTVLDTQTGLLWQQASSPADSWGNAGTACAGSSLPGHGWRRPSLTELQTIIDDSRASPSVDPVFFVSPGSHWTSTEYAMTTGNAWLVSLDDGHTSYGSETTSNPFLCVGTQ